MLETPSDLTKEEMLCLWIFRNRGVCAKIARENQVSGSFVRGILYGGRGMKSGGLRIEKALAEAGAPFMKERIVESLSNG